MAGHAVYTPDNRKIEIDYDALRELQKSNFLNGRRTKIRDSILQEVCPGVLGVDLLSVRTRNHLGGAELTGPLVCTCGCSQCLKRENL
jgi:hypothetical protein